MTPEILQKTILKRRLSKDELDKFWSNLFGFIPVTILIISGLLPIISPKTTMSMQSIKIILALGIGLFAYSIYAKLTERNLKLIQTNLNKDENERLINAMAASKKWNKLTNHKYFHSFHLPFVWFHFGFKLTLIPTDKGILINFRNRGTVQARMPYQLGIETIKQRRLERIIKNSAQKAFENGFTS